MSKTKMSLKQALERMLFLANEKLSNAKAKSKKWDIAHYKNDIVIINKQLQQLA